MENTVHLLESKLGKLAGDGAGVLRPLCVHLQPGEGLQETQASPTPPAVDWRAGLGSCLLFWEPLFIICSFFFFF